MAGERNSGPGIGIGIDLGTCYSCAAVWINDGVQIIPNDGKFVTPSYVGFTETGRLIGEEAKDLVLIDPANTVFDAKRLIGRKFKDSVVQDDIKLWPFKVISGPFDKPMVEVTYKHEVRRHYAEEISAMILSKLKQSAEAFLGTTVKNAVITVPAYFNDAQKKATKDAGTIAGLNVMRIIVEPTAAAIAYAHLRVSRDLGKRNVLVFDLGGGTFDVSILTVERSEFRVMAVSGDSHLGGEDFVNRMVNHFVEDFKRKHGKDIAIEPRTLRRLRAACEMAKIKLSSMVQTSIEIDYLYPDIHFNEKMSRGKFEELNIDLFKECIKHVESCLKEAKVDKTHIHDVVLVGGSTRIPKVQELLRDFFNGKELCKSIHPDEAVAYGAAVQAAMLSGEGNEKVRNLVISDVIPLSLGVEINDGEMSTIIPRNSNYPIETRRSYTTCYDNQTSVSFTVYQGERPRVSDNIKLGKCRLIGIPPALKLVPKLACTFSIDNNGIMEVVAEDETTNQKTGMTISDFTGGLTETEIKKMIVQADMYKTEDEYHRRRISAKNSLEYYVYDIRNKIKMNRLPSMLMDRDIEKINGIIESAIRWLDENQQAGEDVLKKKKEELKSICEPLMVQVSFHGYGAGPSIEMVD